jgi:RNA polymerase sigma factor (sigma-70 family)
MRRTAPLRRLGQEKAILPTTAAHDPARAGIAGRAGLKGAGCAGRIRPSPGRSVGSIESGIRTRVHAVDRYAPDEALIKAIARGDRHAMALLYARHHVGVYRFALRLIGDASAAEDIASEVFLDVWRQAEGFKARARVSTWLLAITRNKSLSEVKRRFDKRLDFETIEMADPADDPEVLVQKQDRSEVIQRCLSGLSGRSSISSTTMRSR